LKNNEIEPIIKSTILKGIVVSLQRDHNKVYICHKFYHGGKTVKLDDHKYRDLLTDGIVTTALHMKPYGVAVLKKV